jgi:hypothetical protein
MTVNTSPAPSFPSREDQPTAAHSVVETPPPALTAADLLPRTWELRWNAGRHHQEAIGLDRLVNEMTVLERAAQYEHLSTTTLLDELSTRWGLSWTNISRLVGVSVPAIRKWRQGEPSSPQNRSQLAQVVALLNTLDFHFMIEDPARWLEIPLASTPLTLIDAIAARRLDLVLDYAGGRVDLPERVLDRWIPAWRERYRDEFETFVAPDGHRGIRVR